MGIPKKAVANRKSVKKDELKDGYKRDPKTGKVYRTIPKLEIDQDGYSDVMVDGLAGIHDDPLDSAESFLGHLRVAPTPEELAELRAEKLRQARKKKKLAEGDDDKT